MLTDAEVCDALWNLSDSVAWRCVTAMKPHVSRECMRALQEQLEQPVEGTASGRRELRQRVAYCETSFAAYRIF